MYDYNNGRFLSVDPFIQDPSSTQSLNPYTYIFNNPLSGTDPSGYTAKLEDAARITKIERFAPTGSNIKSGVKFSGVTASGDNFSFSTVGGEIVSSNGIDFSGSQGPSTKSEKQSSDTGKQSNLKLFVKAVSNHGGEIVKDAVKGAFNQATDETSQEIAKTSAQLWGGGVVVSGAIKVVQWTIRIRKLLTLGRMTKLDLFGGKVSQLAGEGFVSVDLVAINGVRASASNLPFKTGTISEIVASGPQAKFLAEAARVLKPGGRIFINATKGNKFGKLKAAELEALGLRVIQKNGPLLDRFKNLTFRRTDGGVMSQNVQRTSILEKL